MSDYKFIGKLDVNGIKVNVGVERVEGDDESCEGCFFEPHDTHGEAARCVIPELLKLIQNATESVGFLTRIQGRDSWDG